MSCTGNQLIESRKTLLSDNQSKFNETIKQIKEEIFKQLKPEDYKYLLKNSRLLSLRDSNPSKCTGESSILFHDPTVPRCWRTRAGIYRAEALMILGFDKLAKDQLILAGRLLESDDHLQPVDLIDRNRHQILEALIAWSIALGKISSVPLSSGPFSFFFSFYSFFKSPHPLYVKILACPVIDWGIVEGPNKTELQIKLTSKANESNLITSSGKLLSAGYPSSLSLSALDLKYC